MARFKEAREKAGFTQKEAAINLDVSVQAVSYWETGNRTPSIEKILQMCELYGVTADYILGRDPIPVIIKKEAPPPLPEGMKQMEFDFGSGENASTDDLERRIVEIVRRELRGKGL